MPVPSHRRSRAKKGMARAHKNLPTPTRSVCPKCGETKRPHHVCPACGEYKDRTYRVKVVQ